MEKKKLKEALLKAYEAGWRGSLELKEEYAEEQASALLADEPKPLTIDYKPLTVTLPDIYTTSFEGGGAADNWQQIVGEDGTTNWMLGDRIQAFPPPNLDRSVPEFPEIPETMTILEEPF